MTRNNALRSAAFLATLVIANATRLGAVLQYTAERLVADIGAQAGHSLSDLEYVVYLAAHPDTPDVAWWVAFVALSLIAAYAGRICVGIWGDPPVRAPASTSWSWTNATIVLVFFLIYGLPWLVSLAQTTETATPPIAWAKTPPSAPVAPVPFTNLHADWPNVKGSSR